MKRYVNVVISAAAVFLVLLVFVLKSVFAVPSESIPVGEDVVSSNIPIKQEMPEEAFRFRKAEYLTEHFQKHGAEFPYATEEEYLLGANNVIQNPSALHKLEAEDGDDVYYVESTREFVVVSTDGYIRTYFLADLDYYNRQ